MDLLFANNNAIGFNGCIPYTRSISKVSAPIALCFYDKTVVNFFYNNMAFVRVWFNVAHYWTTIREHCRCL
jgi:hypothetical protein